MRAPGSGEDLGGGEGHQAWPLRGLFRLLLASSLLLNENWTLVVLTIYTSISYMLFGIIMYYFFPTRQAGMLRAMCACTYMCMYLCGHTQRQEERENMQTAMVLNKPFLLIRSFC